LFRREKVMGTISNDNKRILKNKLETAKEWLEGAIDEVDAIENRPCWHCIGIEKHNLAHVSEYVDVDGVKRAAPDLCPLNFCASCGRDLKGETRE
jgi:hypothetical protein